ELVEIPEDLKKREEKLYNIIRYCLANPKSWANAFIESNIIQPTDVAKFLRLYYRHRKAGSERECTDCRKYFITEDHYATHLTKKHLQQPMTKDPRLQNRPQPVWNQFPNSWDDNAQSRPRYDASGRSQQSRVD